MTDERSRTPLRPLAGEPSPAPENASMAAIFAQVEPLPPLSEIASVRLRRRLDREIARLSNRGLPGWLTRAAAVAAALFVLEAVAVAAIGIWPPARHRIFGGSSAPRALPAVTAAGTPSSPGAWPEPTPGAPFPPTIPSVSAPEASALAANSPPRTSLRAGLHSRPRVPTAPDDPEVSLYTRALTQLNAQHDPAAALETLRTYRSQARNGLFRSEAAVVEVRANLMLGRESEALALLDVMQAQAFAGYPQVSELTLLRAELLGRAERCDEALPALAPYVDGPVPTAERERALYARALCRAKTGDPKGSRQDLLRYLHDFPDGRFAGQVGERLAAHGD
jgi:hypothetical protein